MSHETLQAVPRQRGRPRLEGAEDQALDAVVELLERAPLRDITMERIAERAGVSKITLYRRWPSRLALFVDTLLRRMAETQPLDEEAPPLAAIATHLVHMARQMNGQSGALARAVIGECLADPEMTHVLRDRYLGHRRATAIRIIGRGLQDGSFRAGGDAEARHDMLYGAIWYRILFGTGRFNDAEALALMESVLQPAPGWRQGWQPPAQDAPGRH
ncbi:TetR family transcriptional regulator [Siccirubricoccus deserti]|uniref:TetR/AcrR family transcriptional regulator n=1 Tax=Siccirubricoccus deserti TaxID=2013562 RepID=A0A9X0QZW2_9PROT|nr:TetR/AcrR family transcriptional regulator [Siccirubricoccus deserti]MBC4015722.1 TetR/AcrR family transcriptional regulator [Siccirubricoccus deserti]GGC44073.1 TetR family transcriptional regulator [Siccirubricoccus deserti]